MCPSACQNLNANIVQKHTSPFASAILAFLVVFGSFNRITFPAFLVIPALRLIPHFLKKYVPFAPVRVETILMENRPLTFLIMVISGLATLFIAIIVDTEFYTNGEVTWSHLFSHPVITPLNNLIYNLQSSNLAQHGLHPWYQHLLINLPQLLGPAFLLLFLQPHASIRLYSAISGIIVLSIFQHQEARFLLPTIPLILSSVQLPRNHNHMRIWTGFWIVFNVIFGVLMGTYHQGGIVPTQFFLANRADATNALWWKTYSPPIWLLNGKNEVLGTHDLMGMSGDSMMEQLSSLATCSGSNMTEPPTGTYLIAPLSATYLDSYLLNESSAKLKFEEVWRYRNHLNLDDLDFGDDGIWPTLKRVIGRRGLGVWRATKDCAANR
jgi:phosphatidylinositol glycan class Z